MNGHMLRWSLYFESLERRQHQDIRGPKRWVGTNLTDKLVLMYGIEGTKLPEGAIAVQEEGDHISLQCSKQMKKEGE